MGPPLIQNGILPRNLFTLMMDNHYIYLHELLVLLAWYCAPAFLGCLLISSFFSWRLNTKTRSVAFIVRCVFLAFGIPLGGILLVVSGVGHFPDIVWRFGEFNGMVPWFWQSWLVGIFLAGMWTWISFVRRNCTR